MGVRRCGSVEASKTFKLRRYSHLRLFFSAFAYASRSSRFCASASFSSRTRFRRSSLTHCSSVRGSKVVDSAGGMEPGISGRFVGVVLTSDVGTLNPGSNRRGVRNDMRRGRFALCVASRGRQGMRPPRGRGAVLGCRDNATRSGQASTRCARGGAYRTTERCGGNMLRSVPPGAPHHFSHIMRVKW